MAKIMNQCSVRMMITLVIAAFLTSQVLVTVSARYLPTRSQDDRLEKLRELLRDVSAQNELTQHVILYRFLLFTTF